MKYFELKAKVSSLTQEDKKCVIFVIGFLEPDGVGGLYVPKDFQILDYVDYLATINVPPTVVSSTILLQNNCSINCSIRFYHED